MEQETLYNILTGQYGEILETHAMWQCIASLGIKPFKDGDMWCYLYGDNTQEGICGFGETIYKAAWDFYSNIKTEESGKIERHLRKYSWKPAEWSKEDKEMLHTVICDLKRHDSDAYAAEIKWLNCLDERFNLQPKQEWSEEDEEMLEQAIKCVNNSEKLEVSTEEIESWLKSLRPSWKPSEEQMKALDIYRKVPLKYSIDREMLDSLYEQLKKL